MNLIPEIKLIDEINLIGLNVSMNLKEDKTFILFSEFMASRKNLPIKNNLVYCVKEYSLSYFQNFNPAASFTKWAAAEFLNEVPQNFKTLQIPKALYAVFSYKGSSNNHSIFDYIFRDWLPNSNYHLDDRPHFEILGDKFKRNDVNSEEEIFVPICK